MKKARNNAKRVLRAILCASLILCMSLGAVSAFAADAETDANAAETVDVVVLKEDVARGAKITKKHLEVKQFKNVNIPVNVISKTDDIIGMYANYDLYAGEYIYKEQFSNVAKAEVNNELLYQTIKESESNFVYVTDYFPANAGKDVAALIQEIIDKNPKRTIYFPDGEYLISRPIMTPSDGDKSVSLHFSDGAILRADKANWKSEKAVDGYTCSSLVALGARGQGVNNNRKNGSYFYLMGGIFDGNGVADGVSIERGRETLIRNVCIVNFKKIGLNIPRGTNSSSSDDDIEDVTIVANGSLGTVGVNLVGYDNTLTNIRIYDCEKGLHMESGGNVLRDIRAYYSTTPKMDTLDKVYSRTIGIEETCGGNFIFHCYAENYATGIKVQGGTTTVDNCRVVWTSSEFTTQTAYATVANYSAYMSCCSAQFTAGATTKYMNAAGWSSGKRIEAPMYNSSLLKDNSHANYIKYGAVPIA